MNTLEKEFKYYLANKEDLHKQYEGQFIVIKNKEVIGVYNDRLEAINTTLKEQHKLGTFLVQHVVESEEQARFHSRYSF